jgi:squalene synthase HpnD
MNCDSSLEVEIERKVKQSGTSFYWAMRLLSLEKRKAMFAVYAFCREVDDIADDDGMEASERQARLSAWRLEIDRLFEGKPELPLAKALVGPVERFGLRKADFLAVIDGMVMDVDPIIAPSREILDLYCDRVASAVGRLSNRVFGAPLAISDHIAHHLGRALQLTNILRDLAEDAMRNRLYLAAEDLTEAGIIEREPAAVLVHPALPQACKIVALRAQAHFVEADKALAQCDAKLMRPALMMRAVYHRTLEKLLERGWSPLNPPVKLAKWEKLLIAFKARCVS